MLKTFQKTWLITSLSLSIFAGLLIGCHAKQTVSPSPAIIEEPTKTPSSTFTLLPPTRTRIPRTVFVRPTLVATETQPATPTLVPATAEFTITSTALTTQTSSEQPSNSPTPSPSRTPSSSRTVTPSNLTVTPTNTPTIAPTPNIALINSPPLLYFTMFDENNGWGLTDRYILRTSQGGNPWTNTTPGGAFPVNSILQGYFLNTNEGWVVLPSADLTTGTIYRTTNGGNSWLSVSVPFGICVLSFIDSNKGWALVDRGSGTGSQLVDVYQTLDGGINWQLVYQLVSGQLETPGEIPHAGIKTGIAFLNQDRGWVTGTDPEIGKSLLFISQDSGSTWTRQVLSLPSNYQESTLTVESPKFFNNRQGLIPVHLYQVSPSIILYYTEDSGDSWTGSIPTTIDGFIDCVSLKQCRLWNGVTLLTTDDGAVTWQQYRTNVNLRSSLTQMEFVNPDVGFALSVPNIATGILYKTIDGGKTWKPLW